MRHESEPMDEKLQAHVTRSKKQMVERAVKAAQKTATVDAPYYQNESDFLRLAAIKELRRAEKRFDEDILDVESGDNDA